MLPRKSAIGIICLLIVISIETASAEDCLQIFNNGETLSCSDSECLCGRPLAKQIEEFLALELEEINSAYTTFVGSMVNWTLSTDIELSEVSDTISSDQITHESRLSSNMDALFVATAESSSSVRGNKEARNVEYSRVTRSTSGRLASSTDRASDALTASAARSAAAFTRTNTWAGSAMSGMASANAQRTSLLGDVLDHTLNPL